MKTSKSEQRRRQRMNDDIIAAINHEKEARNMSGRELSELSGVSMMHLYSILRGEQDPKLKTVVAICNALDMQLYASKEGSTVDAAN